MNVNMLASAITRRLRNSGRDPRSLNALASLVAKRIQYGVNRPTPPRIIANAVAARIASHARPAVKVRVDALTINRIASATARRFLQEPQRQKWRSVDRLADAIAQRLGYEPLKRKTFVEILASAVATRLTLRAESPQVGQELPVMEETIDEKDQSPSSNAEEK